jgi:hypothetical protein
MGRKNHFKRLNRQAVGYSQKYGCIETNLLQYIIPKGYQNFWLLNYWSFTSTNMDPLDRVATFYIN